MPSASVLAMLAKRGSPALSSRPVEAMEERGVEGTSKFVTPVKDLSDSGVNPEDGALASKGKEKRKHKKDVGGSSSRHERSSKRSRGLPPFPKSDVGPGKAGSYATETAEMTLNPPDSSAEVLASCKRQLGLVRVPCLPLFFRFSFILC